MDQSLFDLTAMLVKHEVVRLEELWPHIESCLGDGYSDKDEIDDLKEMQNKSVDYLYQLLFKTIMNAEQFDKEM